jgi:hypothetical protein
MGNAIFGKPVAPPPPEKKAPSIQEQLTVLEKRKNYLEKLVQTHARKAQESTTKEDALLFLQMKQRHEHDLKNVHAMIERLESLESTTSQVLFQKETLAVVKQATNVINNNKVDIDTAEEIMDNVRDATDDVEQVSNVFAREEPPNPELEAEVNKMFETRPPVIVNLPDVPRPVPKKEVKVEDELRMLVAS